MKQAAFRNTEVVALGPPEAPFRSGMHDYLSRLVVGIGYPQDRAHRYLMVAHLFDDTMRMLDALAPVTTWDAIIGVPYSSNRPGVAERWAGRFGAAVHIPPNLAELERLLVEQLARSLSLCRRNGQRLIVQEVGGFVTPLLGTYFSDQLHLVKGVVEITKQGVWRAADLAPDFPVLHCADSEMKRFEAQRCGETVARCLDGLARGLGLSLAGRRAAVIGAGWIGSGVARGLARLDMIPALIDHDPLKVVEARLNGFAAHVGAASASAALSGAQLVVGATGRPSITAAALERLPHDAIVASASSRQLEIDVAWLRRHPVARIGEGVEAFRLPCTARPGGEKRLLLVNDGFPANFLPGSGSVADEIVETILGELIVLMRALADRDFAPGIHRITPEQEGLCARLWLEMRDAG